MNKKAQTQIILLFALIVGLFVFGTFSGFLGINVIDERFAWQGFEWTAKSQDGTSGNAKGTGFFFKDEDKSISISTKGSYHSCGVVAGNTYYTCEGEASLSSNLDLCDFHKVKIKSEFNVLHDGLTRFDPSHESSIEMTGLELKLDGYVKGELTSTDPTYTKIEDNQLLRTDLQGRRNVIQCPALFNVQSSSNYGHKQKSSTSSRITEILTDYDGNDIWDKYEVLPETEKGKEVGIFQELWDWIKSWFT